ncbi:MAG: hypothetical protein P4K86_12640 [Terracidiphilus sp.]|nr:hypothetical protein [Terracidiphilus sp.]
MVDLASLDRLSRDAVNDGLYRWSVLPEGGSGEDTRFFRDTSYAGKIFKSGLIVLVIVVFYPAKQSIHRME